MSDPIIHPTALVGLNVQLSAGVRIGPFCILEDGVTIGEGSQLESRVRLYPGTHLGKGVRVFDGAVLGAAPQDLKYAGEATTLEIGDGVVVREYCTLNRGTAATGHTTIGAGTLLMAYVHVAHDCHVGARAVLANGVQLGGHVEIGEAAILGGNTAVHQFCRIGALSYIGGTLKVDRDVPPACRAFGDPLRWAGLNRQGLLRKGFSEDRLRAIGADFRRLYRSGAAQGTVIEEWLEGAGADPLLLDFFRRPVRNLLAAGA